ncbi:MAG: response regulator, partial [bacterium]
MGTCAQAVTLRDLRLGQYQTKDRFVFELDGDPQAQIEFDDQAIRIRFENLTVPDLLIGHLTNKTGKIIGRISYSREGSRSTFLLEAVGSFRLEHFILANPYRLVLDVYSSEGVPQAMPATEPDPASSVEEESKEEVLAETTLEEEAIIIPEIPSEEAVAAEEPLESGALLDSSDDDATVEITSITESQAAPDSASPESAAPISIPTTASKSGWRWLYLVIPITFLGLFLLFRLSAARRSSRSRSSFPETLYDSLLPEDEKPKTIRDIALSLPNSQMGRTVPIVQNAPSTSHSRDTVSGDKTMGDPENLPKVHRTSAPRQVVEETSAELDLMNGQLTWLIRLQESEHPGRIMIVDDEAAIVSSLREYLERERFEVLGFTDSQTALKEFAEFHPDLLIVDVVMPGMDGVELVKKIRQQNQLGKVIFLSGKIDRETVVREFEKELDSGKYEFFRKPYSLQQISGRIKDYFNEAKLLVNLNLTDAGKLERELKSLSPVQLIPLQRFLWEKIFEVVTNLLKRRIESFYILDRLEPTSNYQHRVGCRKPEDACISDECFTSDSECVAAK